MTSRTVWAEVQVRTPAAEVEIDEALVAALLREQFPELSADVRIVASGWDNVIARVGADRCVRMPRRELSAPLVRHEADWLPRLAPTLPVAVPTAIAIGRPGRGYPWTWLVCPWFSGRPLADVVITNRIEAASQLGAFVAALHRSAPDEAPVNRWRGVPLVEVEPVVAGRLAELPADTADRLWPVWQRSLAAEAYAGPPTWVHGDLHPLNVLAQATRPGLRAVLDWGDLCRGDPAVDLAIAWLGFDVRGRTAFRAAASGCHPPGDPVWERALGWAVALGSLFLLDALPGTAAYAVGHHLLDQLDPP